MTRGDRAMRIVSWGHAVFAGTMIALGIMGLIKGNFTSTWSGVPRNLPMRETLMYLSALISLLCGIGLLWRRTAAATSSMLLGYLLLWLLLFRLPHILSAPAAIGTWWGIGDTAVMVAAAWALFAQFAAERDGILWAGFDPLRCRAFHQCQGDGCADTALAPVAHVVGVLLRRRLHCGGRRGAHRRLRTSGSYALGAGAWPFHARYLGTDR